MPRRVRHQTSLSALALVFGALFLVGACKEEPRDLREWQPSDHDHVEAPEAPQGASPSGQSDAAKTLSNHGVTEVSLLAWKKRCVPCHGIIGRGDGPEGRSAGARDLTDPEWQKEATDERIFASIRDGKGAMPGSDLPDSTITALVGLIRLLDRSGAAREASAAESAPALGASAAPSASALPKRASPAGTSSTSPRPTLTKPATSAP